MAPPDTPAESADTTVTELHRRLAAAEAVCVLATCSPYLARDASNDIDRALAVLARRWQALLTTHESIDLHARLHLDENTIRGLAEAWAGEPLPRREPGPWRHADFGELLTTPNADDSAPGGDDA